jgi:hypothetical protein
MTEWRVAKSLLTLRDQVNARWPNRRKDSDGTIGNAEHASRSSDHNPWIHDNGLGIVTAMDITHDPANGCDSYALAQALLNSRDPRIKYVISNRRIASGNAGPSPWVWRKYTGANPHDHHCHISVMSDESDFDSVRTWDFNFNTVPQSAPSSSVTSYVTPPPTLSVGAPRSELVRMLQQLLVAHGEKITVDGYFARETEKAVRAFQTSNGLDSDGFVGPMTWAKLR